MDVNASLKAPRPPTDLTATGLTETFLFDLAIKHLYRGGVMDLTQLLERLALTGDVLESIIANLLHEACVEVLPPGPTSGVRYALTERGRRLAMDALAKSGYLGPAPVTLETYRSVVQCQSVRSVKVTRDNAQRAFRDVIAHQALVDKLGTALNSGRPLFLYGPAGTGKTLLGRRLVRMLGNDTILVPHAILIGDTVIQLYNPAVHHQVAAYEAPGRPLNEGHDARFVRCRRPGVVSGGELTLDMLEVEYDPATKQYHAPQTLLANNGLYMIDDLGRQRLAADALLNRWIVPMEESRDYLTIGASQRFEVPFDVILVFSTNFDPLELADGAFLRRLGHKVPFDYVGASQYTEIWKRMCQTLELEFDDALLTRAFELYESEGRPLLPCHPRDLLTSIVDRLDYEGEPRSEHIGLERLQHAWNTYFVSLADGQGALTGALNK